MKHDISEESVLLINPRVILPFAQIEHAFDLYRSFSKFFPFVFQRSTEQLTTCSIITLAEETAENLNNVTVSRTEKIMSFCRKTLRWRYLVDLALMLLSKFLILTFRTSSALSSTSFSEVQCNRLLSFSVLKAFEDS